MSRTFAEIKDGIVERVIVCDDPAWPAARLGGTWVETKMTDPVENYAGPGMGMDLEDEAKFAPLWRQPEGAHDAPRIGVKVFFDGIIWTNLVDYNTQQPGVSGWRDREVARPDWVQPTGAHDTWSLDDEVMHSGLAWVSDYNDNVWEPGVFGWTEITS